MKRSQHKDMGLIRRSMSLALGICVAAGTATAWAEGDPWTAVGSTGVVDETDAAEVSMSAGIASIKPTAPAATTVVLRYNVTSTPDLSDGGVNKAMTVRFLDNGANARVRVRLISYNLSTGVSTTVVPLFDSDTLPPWSSYRQASVSDGCWVAGFDFHANAYYVEVELSRTAADGTPAISIVRIANNDVC
jgi:hypothetical protein